MSGEAPLRPTISDLEGLSQRRGDAVVPADLEQELRALRAPVFDALIETTRVLFDLPVALITVMAADRYWLRTQGGFVEVDKPGPSAFFNHVIHSPELLVVEDALTDTRFSANPYVNRDEGFRFYVGMALRTSDGRALGVLCGLAKEPRPGPGAQQLNTFRKLAEASMATIEVGIYLSSLDEQSTLLQVSLDAISQGISAFDAEMRLIAWNTKMGEIMGVPAESIHRGMRYEDIAIHLARQGVFGPGDPHEQVRRRAEWLRSQSSYKNDLVFPDGHIAELRGTPLPTGGFVVTHTDVTEERRRAANLEAAARRFKLEGRVATIANEGSNLASALASTVAAICDELGFRFARALQQGVGAQSLVETGIGHPSRGCEDWPCGQGIALSLKALRDRAPLVETDEDGSLHVVLPLPVLGETYVIEGFGGPPSAREVWYPELLAFVGHQLMRVAERERLQRLKDEFISSMNHEMRTPLTVIDGILDLLQAELYGPLPDDAKQAIAMALENSRRLGGLVEDILDLERIEGGDLDFEMEMTALGPAIEGAIASLSVAAKERDVDVQLDDPDHLNAFANAARVTQVVRNLLSNAIKFSPPRGIVSLRVRRFEGRVRISVIDHGTGIPEPFRPKMFDKFTQADGSDARKANGTGLGLTIVKEVAERLGAQLSYDTAVGAGTTFHVDLVASNRPMGEATEPRALETPEPLLAGGGSPAPCLYAALS